MTKPIISVEHLSKAYRIGEREDVPDTFVGAMTGWLTAPARNWRRLRKLNTFHEPVADSLSSVAEEDPPKTNGHATPHSPLPTPHSDVLWALRDVSFEVQEGEVVGIIGRNGAGKSTLLKILSRITEPTHGRAVIRGRISSLLEVGTGFHPELTGRENIYMNGTILGMRKTEIDRKFDEIVDFSGIEQFLDTPVKRYSSGMTVRLAFAVAAHLEPEILIIDEVLAVGDAEFQKKCLGKMQDVARGGRTVLFVSHNMAAVHSLCARGISLHCGKIVADGPVKQVASTYQTRTLTAPSSRHWNDRESAPGNDQFRLRHACIRPATSGDAHLTVGTPLLLEFEYWNLKPGSTLHVAIHVFNAEGIHAFSTVPSREPHWHGRTLPAALFRSTCMIPGGLLNDGIHSVDLIAVKDHVHVIHSHQQVLTFELMDERETTLRWYGKWPGVVRPTLEWRTTIVAADQ